MAKLTVPIDEDGELRPVSLYAEQKVSMEKLILGGDCLTDLQVLRGDPGTQALLGLETILAPTTAGELLRRFGIGGVNGSGNSGSVARQPET